MTKYLCLAILLYLDSLSSAADPDWMPVATELLQREKTGFGGLCGVVVDHQSGDIFVNLSDRGMFHSGDQGQTWKRVSDTQPKGRTETPGCWLLDPTGKTNRMATALVYGAPLSVSSDRAATWKSMDSKSGHIDWCALDWTDPDLRFVLSLKYEAGGLLFHQWRIRPPRAPIGCPCAASLRICWGVKTLRRGCRAPGGNRMSSASSS